MAPPWTREIVEPPMLLVLQLVELQLGRDLVQLALELLPLREKHNCA
jgi:hypothetical protein